ncbi:acetone carboxylase subunit gamma [Pusillimonas sp.]|uniref:acetone carboxylase subunit gamma n=1 Tax=Pusillimonas sp. TaxID=3040095 RepID=UPI0037C69C74
MTSRISPTLVRRDDEGGHVVCCAECGHALTSPEDETHWKDRAVLKTVPVNQQPGWSSSVHPDLVLRQFACNECGHLLDSEVALPEDPFLYDVVEAK